MNTARHLTKEQIAGYAAHSLDHEEKQVVGRHLLQCENCRNLMPAPTTEQLWSAIMGDSEHEEILSVEKHSVSKESPFSVFFSSFGSSRTLAWSGSALLIVAAFSLFIWLGATRQSNFNVEITRNAEMPNTVENKKLENNLPSNEQLSVTISNTDSKDENPKIESTTNLQPPPFQNQSDKRIIIGENTNKNVNLEDKELAVLLDKTPPAVSSLRPNGEMILRGNNIQNPDSARGFTLIAPIGETVLETAPEFRWGKMANAKSYRITIFDADFNEVITAQISGNSYKPNKPLKHGEKYLWRVVAETNNGEMLSPLPPRPPAMFRVAEEKTESRIDSLKKSEKSRFKLAVFYAKEGMLDSAHCTLTEILRKNSKHKAARRLLAKVEQWQKENQTFIQRCGPPTTTKPAQ